MGSSGKMESAVSTVRIENILDAAPSVGRKADKGKPRWSLLPRGAVMRVIDVLEFGAMKYAPDNWKRVPDARTRYYDALHRHVEAWWGGERTDPDSGLHHLAHAACCVLFLLWFDTERSGDAG